MQPTVPSYSERIEAARRRLRAALTPQNDQEHAAMRHLERCVGDLATAETLALLIERRLRTTRRAARMDLAQQTLAFWQPGPGAPPDVRARLDHIASGGDDDQDGNDVARLVAEAYERGWREGIEHARGRGGRS